MLIWPPEELDDRRHDAPKRLVQNDDYPTTTKLPPAGGGRRAATCSNTTGRTSEDKPPSPPRPRKIKATPVDKARWARRNATNRLASKAIGGSRRASRQRSQPQTTPHVNHGQSPTNKRHVGQQLAVDHVPQVSYQRALGNVAAHQVDAKPGAADGGPQRRTTRVSKPHPDHARTRYIKARRGAVAG